MSSFPSHMSAHTTCGVGLGAQSFDSPSISARFLSPVNHAELFPQKLMGMR